MDAVHGYRYIDLDAHGREVYCPDKAVNDEDLCSRSEAADAAGDRDDLWILPLVIPAGADHPHQSDSASRCECELPGFFDSGVPGILAHLVDGRLPANAQVQACDMCQRFASDAAALDGLRRRGLA